MLFLFGIVLQCLYLAIHSANILATVGVPGSHFFLTKSIAELLADEGHNVTLICSAVEPRVKVDPRIHYVEPVPGSDIGYDTLDKYINSIDHMILSVIGDDVLSENMGTDFITHGDSTKYHEEQWEAAFQFFTSSNIQNILNTNKFDVVIAEETSLPAVATATYRSKIPIIAVSAISGMMAPRDRSSLPLLLSSEPGFQNPTPVLNVPTFEQRLEGFISLLKIVYTFNVDIFGGKIRNKYLAPYGIETPEQFKENIAMTFVNDHPAVSFPYLAPPNTVYLAGFHLPEYGNRHHSNHNQGNQNQDKQNQGNQDANSDQQLPEVLSTFIDTCVYAHVIYVSFGTYLRRLEHVPWLENFLKYLQELDACIIFKAASGVDPDKLDSKQFIVLPWVPQKALLGSGKLTMFISHCGNNGRIEAAFYNVPILCIPIIADQLLNAYLVKRNGFGTYIFKEHLVKEKFISATRWLFENKDTIRNQLNSRTCFMKNEPGVGKDAILFHVNHLAENGNIDYLRNGIISKQYIFEIYNLDVWLLWLILVVCLGLVALVAVKLATFLRKLYNQLRHMLQNNL